jgi:hypothetical protein
LWRNDFALSGERILDRIKMLSSKNIPLTAATLHQVKRIPVPAIEEGRRRMVLQHMDELGDMSDGQIWLDEDWRRRDSNHRPAAKSYANPGIGADTDSPMRMLQRSRNMVEGFAIAAGAGHMEGAKVNSASKRQLRTQILYYWLCTSRKGSGWSALVRSCTADFDGSLQGCMTILSMGSLGCGTEGEKSDPEAFWSHVQTNAPSAGRVADS